MAHYAESLVTVGGVNGLIANVYQANKKIRDKIARAAKKAGVNTKRTARELVPKDTTRTEKSIIYIVTKGGMGVSIFPDSFVFESDGVAYYPPWIEFDSSYPAKPFMKPAWDRHGPVFKLDVQRSLKGAFKRAI